MAEGRNYLIAAGTACYDHLPENRQLRSVDADIALIVGWFTQHGYERVLPSLGSSPTKNMLERRLGQWLTDNRRSPHDHLILYYSGHGESVDDDAHYLTARDTKYNERGPLPHTALADDQLARMIAASRIQQALVILDTCYAGRGITELSAKAGTLLRKRHWDESAPLGIYLIAAARPREIADEHAFATAFLKVIANTNRALGGIRQQFLDPPDVVGAVNALFKRDGVRQRTLWIPAIALRGDLPELIPNPLFLSSRRTGLDFEEHWLPKARGGESESAAWYFTGRERATRELALWLAESASDGNARVVTGGPGTGKSALLARLVALSDASQLAHLRKSGALEGVAAETIPPLGAIDVAVHARGKTLADIVAAVANAAGEKTTDPAELVEKLRKRASPLAIVVDALDEAEESRRVVRELLRELAPLPTVRLLVGMRPEQPQAPGKRRVTSLGAAVVEIDLDDPTYLGEHDVEEYVARRLLAEREPGRRTPYRGQPELARDVARAVAARARGVFLVAMMVSRTLIDMDAPVDVRDPHWRIHFPAEVGAAFDGFLDRFDRDPVGELDKRAVIELLRPLAFAEGEGLPRDHVWAAVASAVAGREYVDEEIGSVIRLAGAYVVEASEHGRSAYRLYHEALAEWLREDVSTPRVHGQIVDALVALVPERAASGGRDWLRAHPYVSTHLASHAAKAGRLDELVTDPLFLVAADHMRLLLDLATAGTQVDPALLGLYHRTVHHLRTRSTDEAASYLELAARQSRLEQFAARIAALPLRRAWSVPWASWQPVATHRVISTDQGGITALAIARVEQRLVVLSGGMDGMVQIWDLVTGKSVGEPLRGNHPVSDLVARDLPGGPVAISINGFHSPYEIHAWDLTTREIIARREWAPFAREDGWRPGCAMVVCKDGCLLLMTWARELYDRVLPSHIWHLEGREIRPGPRIALGEGATALALGELHGELVIVSGNKSGELRVYSPADGKPLTGPIRAHNHLIRQIVPAARDDLSVILLSDDSGTVRRWDMESGAAIGEPVVLPRYQPPAPAAGVLKGRPIFVTSGEHSIDLWDLTTGAPLCRPLAGLRSPATHLTICEHHPILVSADGGTLRIWDLADLPPADAPVEEYGRGSAALALGPVAGRPVIVSSVGRVLRVWDRESGSSLGGPMIGHETEICALAIGELEGRALLISGDVHGTLRAWDLEECAPSVKALCPEYPGFLRAIALVTRRGKPVLLSVEQPHNTIRRWDLKRGKPLGAPLVVPDSVFQAAIGEWNRQTIVVTGGDPRVWVWDPWKRRRLGKPLLVNDYVRALALGQIDGRPVILAVSHDHFGFRIYGWNLEGRSAAFSPIPCPDEEIHTVAAGEMNGRSVIVTGSDTGVRIRRGDGSDEAAIDVDATVSALALVPPDRVIAATSAGLMVLKWHP